MEISVVRGKHQRTQLSESLHQRLNSYALAASAAGVGMLALTQPAEAKIIYTKAHHVIRPSHIYQLDLNHDGLIDFAIHNRIASNGTSSLDILSATPSGRNGVEGKTETGAYALHRGAVIGPKQPFSAGLMSTCFLSGICSGPWLNAKWAYLGLRFNVHGRVHYGWARFKVTATDGRIAGTLTGYAYETIPNKPIIAGKTTGPDVITVPPFSLGHLARGASAILAWRGKESQ